ncbi:ATP-binding cassette domain-containing protein [Streptococcus marmotae]|uniref:ATP-binding cassette domain-containing protein n=1 Tax=Streptococcus marmotae TaxID=1825069 RepID=UPI0008357CA9|nr:ATP-binding cassette domain-containing protein [Streptococcus marmotae]
MLSVRNIIKQVGQQKILNDVSIDFGRNGVYIIVGTNGCGKTTFMNIVNNMLLVDKGTIVCEKFPVGSKNYKDSIFYIPSDFYLPEYLTGDEYLQFVLQHYSTSSFDKVEFLFSLFDLSEERDKLLENYSFGMKKKIQIIAAILSNTPYIFADELFSGLDFDTVILLQELLQQLEKERCFVLVSHDLNVLTHFPNKIYIMSNGNLTHFTSSVDKISEAIKEVGDLHVKLQNIQKYFVSA